MGNRLSRVSNLPGVFSAAHTFDVNDRLTSDSYDANGNTTAGHVETGGPVVADSYDFEDRLVSRNGPVTLARAQLLPHALSKDSLFSPCKCPVSRDQET